MASFDAKHARGTLLLESVNGLRSLKSDANLVQVSCQSGNACPKRSSVVEHLVFFNMPYLQGDQEAAILQALYDMQFKYENVLLLVVGRNLNMGVGNVTHALFMRFPTVKILQSYYKSDVLSEVAYLMVPHLHGEITVDYVTSAGFLDPSKKEPMCATATFLRRKRDVSSEKMERALFSLVKTLDDASYVADITAGSNLFVRGDKFYTHACATYVDTVTDLDKLAEDSQYTTVLKEDALPLSSRNITVNIMAYKPIKAAL